MDGKENKINRTPLLPRDIGVFEAESIGIRTSNAVKVANGNDHLSCF
jgi:hypothetical protein